MTPLDFYRQFIGPNDLVFDVGACVYKHAEIFRKITQKIVCFEARTNSGLASGCGKRTIFYSPMRPSVASMSLEWIAAVKKSGRFGTEDHWTEQREVVVSTLDYYFQFGKPAFIKIDVEGYELEVLKGLSQPVRALSFEFTPECLDQAFACVQRCNSLGMKLFNLSLLEDYELGEWTDSFNIYARLEQYRDVITTYGDVYARV